MSVLANLIVKMTADTTALQKGLQGAKGQMSKFSGAINAAGTAGAAALAGLGTASIKMGLDFEKSMAEVKTLMPDVSEKAFGKLKDDVLAFSKEMGVATEKAVPALYQAISAGVPQENVMDFMTVASKAAIGGVTELETAVDGITSVVNAYGAEVMDAQKAADLMFTGVKLGKTTFDELSASLYNVAPLAAATGVSFEEVTAALAALTAQGVPTAQASTQLRAAIQSLTAPTSRQATLIKELGLDFSAAALQQKGLSDAMKEAIEATGGNMEQLRKLLGSVEAVQAVLALGGDQAYKFDDALTQMGESTGAAEKAFDTMADTASYKLNKTINELKVEMTRLGSKALPLVVGSLEKIRPMIIPLIASIGALVAAWGTWKIGSLIWSIGRLTTSLGSLRLAILGPAGVVAALGAGGFLLGRFIDKNREAIDKLPVLGGLVSVAASKYESELNPALAKANDLFERQIIDAGELSKFRLVALKDALIELGKTGVDFHAGLIGPTKEMQLQMDLTEKAAAELVKDMQREGATLQQVYAALERAGLHWKDTTIEDVLQEQAEAFSQDYVAVVTKSLSIVSGKFSEAAGQITQMQEDLAQQTGQSFEDIKDSISSLLPIIDQTFQEWTEQLTEMYAAQINFDRNLRELYAELAAANVQNVGDIVRTVEEGGPLAAQAAADMLREGTMGLESYRLLGEQITVSKAYTGDIVGAIEEEKIAMAKEMVSFARVMITAFASTLEAETPQAVQSVANMTGELKKALTESPIYKTWSWGVGMAEDLARGLITRLNEQEPYIKRFVGQWIGSEAALAGHSLSSTPALVGAGPAYAPLSAAGGVSGGGVHYHNHNHFDGPLLGDQRQLEEIADRLVPVIRRRMG